MFWELSQNQFWFAGFTIEFILPFCYTDVDTQCHKWMSNNIPTVPNVIQKIVLQYLEIHFQELEIQFQDLEIHFQYLEIHFQYLEIHFQYTEIQLQYPLQYTKGLLPYSTDILLFGLVRFVASH